jgi:hypothetical protein
VASLAAAAILAAGCGSSAPSAATGGAGSGGAAQSGSGCPHASSASVAYKGQFVGPQSTKQSTHVVQVTRNGRPVSGARVCVAAAMVGMTSMHYAASGTPMGRGRYSVPFKFGMAGVYRGRLVLGSGSGAVSIPVSATVSNHTVAPSGTMHMGSGAKKMHMGSKSKKAMQMGSGTTMGGRTGTSAGG